MSHITEHGEEKTDCSRGVELCDRAELNSKIRAGRGVIPASSPTDDAAVGVAGVSRNFGDQIFRVSDTYGPGRRLPFEWQLRALCPLPPHLLHVYTILSLA